MKKVYSVINHSGSFYIVLPYHISRKYFPRRVRLEILSEDQERKEIVMRIKVLEEREHGLNHEEYSGSNQAC